MSTVLATAVEGLNSVLLETGFLMQKVVQGGTTSAASLDRVMGLVTDDIHRRLLEIAKHAPSAGSVRHLQERRATLGAMELAVRRAAHEMNETLGRLLQTPSPGTYSPEMTRVASAGAWMNVRSSP